MKQLPKTLYAFIVHFLQCQWRSFGLMALSMAFWSINEALYPYFTKILINQVERLQPGLEAPFTALAFPLLGLLICWLLMEASMRSLGIVSMYAWPEFRKNIRESVFMYTQGHSHSYFANHFAGSVANKISDLPRACEHIVDIFITSFFAIALTFCISLAVVFQVNVIFGVILISWVAIFMGLTFIYLPKVNTTAEMHAESVSVLNGRVVDSLSGMIAVRLFSHFDYELKYLRKYQKDEINKSRNAIWAIEKLNIFRGLLSCAFMIVMFATLVYGWNQKWVSLGDFSLIAITSFNLMGLVWHCAYNITQVVKQIGIAQAALSLLSVPHGIQDVPHARPLVVTKGEIVFDRVTFQYKRNTNVFKEQTVKIEAGQKVGLVGFSGSGKSTFVNLILRFYDIHEGRILIDGQDISQVTQASLRTQIAMIPQDPVLFHRTLLDNIRYGRLDATDEEVFEAARLANCDEFIQHLEASFQTTVGERGIKLSGGQRQRIAIARALLKNAPILIMDEATSALDSVTEKMIQESLKELMKNRTSLLIAHRLSTLRDMDRILVFHKGEIIEDGTVRGLLRKKGHFAQLWHMQSGGFLPETAEGA
ncbi:MAG: ABC transporter ATP-binding protein [Caedimonas sp.]|nr:ABC transporter ATP-binding protein [Caedimonas sp.]